MVKGKAFRYVETHFFEIYSMSDVRELPEIKTAFSIGFRCGRKFEKENKKDAKNKK